MSEENDYREITDERNNFFLPWPSLSLRIQVEPYTLHEFHAGPLETRYTTVLVRAMLGPNSKLTDLTCITILRQRGYT